MRTVLFAAVVLALACSCAQASLLTEAADVVGENALDVADSLATGVEFLKTTLADASDGGVLTIYGPDEAYSAIALQGRFGSYQGTPFGGNVAAITSGPAENKLTLGAGAKCGSYKAASIMAYVQVVPDEIAGYVLPDPLDHLGLDLGVGITVPLG